MINKTLVLKTRQFFNCTRIAVIGVSPKRGHEASADNYRRLKKAGYEVFTVNPYREEFEGNKCYSHIHEIPVPIEAALIFTHPKVTPGIVKECYESGVRNIWIHKGIGNGSRSKEASDYLHDKPDVNFIDGACPLMFINNADPIHRGVKNVLGLLDKLPA